VGSVAAELRIANRQLWPCRRKMWHPQQWVSSRTWLQNRRLDRWGIINRIMRRRVKVSWDSSLGRIVCDNPCWGTRPSCTRLWCTSEGAISAATPGADVAAVSAGAFVAGGPQTYQRGRVWMALGTGPPLLPYRLCEEVLNESEEHCDKSVSEALCWPCRTGVSNTQVPNYTGA
jgi:hypothetical protein